MMKPGDLVNFHTDAWVFERANDRYQNPGIVLRKLRGKDASEVLWADGRITKEHFSYLRLVNNDTQAR
jgi:hypothetical protein